MPLAVDVASARHVGGTAPTRAGAEVVTVVDGLHAVVLDHATPKTDGFAFAETLRADEFPCAIVGDSAEPPASDLLDALAAAIRAVAAR